MMTYNVAEQGLFGEIVHCDGAYRHYLTRTELLQRIDPETGEPVIKVDPELNMIVVRGAIPGPKGGLVYVKSTVKTQIVKQASVAGTVNPQKASARMNPQKASARMR